MKVHLTLYGLALAIIIACAAKAEDPHSMYHEWYKDLQSNQGGSCCSEKDGRPSNYRSYNGELQILINDRWCRIDENAVLHGKVAPDRGTHVFAPVPPIKGAECTQFCVIIGIGS